MKFIEILSRLPFKSYIHYTNPNRNYWDIDDAVTSRDNLLKSPLETYFNKTYEVIGVYLQELVTVEFESIEKFDEMIWQKVGTQHLEARTKFEKKVVFGYTSYSEEELEKASLRDLRYELRRGHCQIDQLKYVKIDHDSLHDMVTGKNIGEYLISPDKNIRALAKELSK